MLQCIGKIRRATPLGLAALLLGLAFLVSAQPANAQTSASLAPTTSLTTVRPETPDLASTLALTAPTFVSAPNRVDMVPDLTRRILYITSGGDVLRYNIDTHQFLTPFTLGGSLTGMDLSLDGDTLAVADGSFASGQAWFYLVNLQTSTSQKVVFPSGYMEGGTFSVAFGKDGRVLITSRTQVLGWAPLRKYDPVSGAVTSLYLIMPNTMLSSSADGTIIGFAESSSPDGPWGRYRVLDESIVERIGYTDGTGKLNYEIATNRNATQFAIPTSGGTYFYNSFFSKVGTLGVTSGPQPIGAVYHPTQDIVYLTWPGTQEVRGYETATFTQVSAFNMGYTFQTTNDTAYVQGRLKIARDGSLLFATVTGGVSYVSTTRTVTIDTLIADLSTDCAQGWINRRPVCTTLGNKLDEARMAMNRGDSRLAQRKLEDFVEQLDQELGTSVNQQAYDQLKPDAMYLIDQLAPSSSSASLHRVSGH